MSAYNRRFDIDWLRVIAIGLLLLYHVSICFQPWGIMLGFITNREPLHSLWTPMTMLNVWRIPLLFFVSGMGVYFASTNRNWKQLLMERARRILIPFVFGIFIIVPIHFFIFQKFLHRDPEYVANPSHLWFLGNILIYLLIFFPLFYYLKKRENGKVVRTLKKILSTPFGLIPVVLVFMAEVVLVKPMLYELYAMTWHGFFLGMIAFFFGFCFVLCGDHFWKMILKWRWLFFIVAISLYSWRLYQSPVAYSSLLLVLETNSWILTLFAFAYQYLNRSSGSLSYLSKAAYPVYIIHMIILFLGSWIILPLHIAVQWKFIMLILFTAGGSLAVYELVIRRVKWIGFIFGIPIGK